MFMRMLAGNVGASSLLGLLQERDTDEHSVPTMGRGYFSAAVKDGPRERWPDFVIAVKRNSSAYRCGCGGRHVPARDCVLRYGKERWKDLFVYRYQDLDLQND